MQTIRIGLVGIGTVGASVVAILRDLEAELLRRADARIEIARYASRRKDRWEELGLDPARGTTDPLAVASDPDVDVVIEVMGGVETAREVVLAALAAGKDVVTANKALLAGHGDEIFDAADRAGRMIGFEASVCGGIPVIHVLKRSLASERIRRLVGIVNGTCNFVLSEMAEAGGDFAGALAEAQRRGFAEADPTLDISGADSAHKLALLSILAWGVRLSHTSIALQGIEAISDVDVAFAAELGMTPKLLAIARRNDDGRYALFVGPCLVPARSLIGRVRGSLNAVLIEGEHLGPFIMTGAGAGGMPTANSVVSDVIEIARARAGGVAMRHPTGFPEDKRLEPELVPFAEQEEEFYLRFSVPDQPGVLAGISTALSERGISIAQVIQHGRSVGQTVPLMILTHEARRGDVAEAIHAIDAMPFIKDKAVIMNVIKEVP
ncbi:homoserine dehydrogenase [bacterium]|nr:homoserine dehydrogenase [bacterium]